MQSRLLSAATILIILFSLLDPACLKTKAAPESAGWQVTGQSGGPAQGIAVQGGFAYLGVGPRLAVVDISDPVNPHAVGYTAPFPDLARGVTVSGTHAYVAAGPAGLRVVDISSPTNPLEVGAWDSPGYAEGVAVSGSTAFLADGPDGLWLVDVSTPSVPVTISNAFDMNYVYDAAIEGRYAYLAAGGAGLLVADISNPAYPVELGSYDTPGNARAVSVLSGRAYVADELKGLQIINATDPHHPALLGSLKTYGWAFDVAVSGSTAYLAAAFGGLRVVNVLDPAHPAEVGNLSWAQSNAGGLALVGSQVYLADRKNGLRVISSADPAHPTQTDLLSLFQFAQMVVTGGDYAYVAAGFNGVRILDIRDPAHPVEVAAYQINALVVYVHLAGSRLYVGTSINSPDMGIHVLDVSDPLHPYRISYYDWVGECRGIDVVGNLGYFADAGGLKIVDFSNLASPQLVGNNGQWAGSVIVRGSLAYVADGRNGVRIFDVSNPANITLAGTFQSANSFSVGEVVFNGQYAYVSEGQGFTVLDVTNPVAPTEVSYTPTSITETQWLWYADSRVYMAEGSYGFEVFDVSNPATPLSLGGFDTIGAAQTLMTAGGNLFLADMEGGLQVFPLASLSAQSRAGASLPAAQHVPQAPPPAPARMRHLASPPVFTAQVQASPAAPDRAAASCVVTSAADSGPGTLRACLENQASGDIITFSAAVFPPASPVTISLVDQLPFISRDAITLDASNAGVILDGENIPGSWIGGIAINSNGSIVRGLQIQHFSGAGIVVIGTNNVIGGSRLIGSGPTGQGNVVSGNQYCGISISSASGNLVIGNIVGLDAGGVLPFGNLGIGIGTWGGQNNIIGSLEPGQNNIIGANGGDGIQFYGYTNDGSQVIGNFIGTDISGTQDRGNSGVGVYVESGTANTLVQGNLISANHVTGVYVWDLATDFNVITGNRVGVTLDGTQPLPNGGMGISLGYAAYTRVGGSEPGEGNLVGSGGVEVVSPFGADTLVLGNRLGLNAAGTAVLPNASGVVLDGASRTIVGGATLAEANYITAAGNFSLNVRSSNNAILGNFFGLAADGLTPLASAGFQITAQRNGNFIQGNHIANATSAGIWLYGAWGNTIRRNSIYANPFKGIFLDNGANNNLPAPSFSLTSSGGSGMTCAGCTVELFLDAGNQGRFYLDNVIADGTGAFQFPMRCPLPYPNLTATATDLLGNTSQFSDPVGVPWDCSSPNPTPSLAAISPTSVIALEPTSLLSITGSGFISTSLAQLNGATLKTRYVDSSHLEAVLPLSQVGITGNAAITVFNPAPGGGTSTALPFTINNPTPTLTGLSPMPATAGSAGFTLTVTGTNFVDSSVIRWNGIDLTTTYISTTQLSSSIDAARIATAGTAAVTVFNPTPGGGTAPALNFTINNPFPALTALSPASIIAGGDAFTLTVSGTGFMTTSVVRWNGTDRTTTYVSATQLTASISAADIVSAGTSPVTVFNPAPGGGVSNPLSFTIRPLFKIYIPSIRR